MTDTTTHLLTHGLRYGDFCTIVPAGGNRRKLKLNRTSFDIVPEGDSNAGQPAISIPGMATRSFRWRMELTELVSGESRYVLRTLDGSFFSLNGQWTREAFVESRDTLCPSGPARLEFSAFKAAEEFVPPNFPSVLQDEVVMRSQLSVLIEGETGTGKGHLAREIHRRSGRAGNFVAINAQAFNSSMVEAELFGHKKGSFTGAITDRKGAIAQAHGGTLFIDEIDSLSRDLQTKLLLFLDDQAYRPVGSEREEKGNVRLIFAAGQPLAQVVKKGLMRTDFYYRLRQGVALQLTPLREKIADIRRHCELFAIEHDVSIGERLIQFYQTLPWPGNVRQLRGHLLTKKVRSKTRKLDFDDCDDGLMTMTSDLLGLPQLNEAIKPFDDVRKAYAQWAMERGQHELAWTAKQLGVHPKTLRQWLS